MNEASVRLSRSTAIEYGDSEPFQQASCKRLLRAMLARLAIDAGASLMKPDILTERAAKQWMMDDEDRPFSFIWICDELEIDPEKFRAKILRRAGKMEARREARKKRLAERAARRRARMPHQFSVAA